MRHSGIPVLARTPWIIALVLAACVGAGASWTLGFSVASGQTIPPWLTDTPTPTARLLLPTPTWTPHPTWTRVPTAPPSLPPTVPAQEQSTPTHVPIHTPGSGQPTAEPSPTLSPASPTPGPAAAVFDVVVDPVQAGPGDMVLFVLQVANVGYAPVRGLRAQTVFPNDLVLLSVDCASCTTSGTTGQLTIGFGDLAAGEQSQLRASALVAQDAWPGLHLQLLWTLESAHLPSQSVLASLELPWAALPATGCPSLPDGRVPERMLPGTRRGLLR